MQRQKSMKEQEKRETKKYPMKQKINKRREQNNKKEKKEILPLQTKLEKFSGAHQCDQFSIDQSDEFVIIVDIVNIEKRNQKQWNWKGRN